MITLTESAVTKLRQLLERDGEGPASRLRIRIADGGCSGMRYELAFDDRVEEFDLEAEQSGVRILIDEKSALYLEGATIDYQDGLNGTGFRVINPNARSTCGCGESFRA